MYFSEYIVAFGNYPEYLPIHQLYFPFEYEVWLCIAGVHIVGIAVILIVNLSGNLMVRDRIFGVGNSTPFLNMIRISLGTSIKVLPTGYFARILLALWMLSCLVLQNSYEGELYTFMRKPKTVPFPKTIDSLIVNNYALTSLKSAFFLIEHVSNINKT